MSIFRCLRMSYRFGQSKISSILFVVLEIFTWGITEILGSSTDGSCLKDFAQAFDPERDAGR